MRIKKTKDRVNTCKCGRASVAQKFFGIIEGDRDTITIIKALDKKCSILRIGICLCGNQVFFRSYVENQNKQ